MQIKNSSCKFLFKQKDIKLSHIESRVVLQHKHVFVRICPFLLTLDAIDVPYLLFSLL